MSVDEEQTEKLTELKDKITEIIELTELKEVTTFTSIVNKERCQYVHLENKNVFIRQLWGFSVCLILNIIAGTVAGYTAIFLPQLTNRNSTIIATESQKSWIASMPPLFMALGCLISGWSMEQFGRKKTLRICSSLFLLGWLLIYFSKTIVSILVGRSITGFCVGYLGPTGSCYIGEISTPKYRGFFLAGISLGIATGYLFAHILGTFLDWQTVALIICSLPIIVLLVMIPVPESHVWLLSKGKFREANLSLNWYSDTESFEEPTTMNNESKKWNYKNFTQKEFVQPVMIMIVFFVTAQFSGNNVVGFYSVELMKSTVPTLNEYAAMLIIDVIRVVMSVIACVLTRRYKTRVLTFISAIGTICSLFAIAALVYLSGMYPNNAVFKSLPLVFLVSYMVFISIGIVPLPWSLSGELLPRQNKGVGGGIATSINFLTFFVVIKTSPDLFKHFGVEGTFAFYGSVTLVLSAVLYCVLPETKNKTLEEIQSLYK